MLNDLYKSIDELERISLNGDKHFGFRVDIKTQQGFVTVHLMHTNFLMYFLPFKSNALNEIAIMIRYPQKKQILKVKNELLFTLSEGFEEVSDGKRTMLIKNHKRDFAATKSDLKNIIESFSVDGNFTYDLSYPELFSIE